MSPQNGALLDMPIAIVGMSCRFPGTATSPSKLWDLLVEGESAWSEIPADRWNKESFYHPDGARTGTTNVRGGHFLAQDVALFDAPFFNVSAEEAKAMDPQLRLQLETCYEALENAGIPLDRISGTKTSVFSGIFTRDYTESMLRDVETLPRYYVTGTGTAMLANRVSYFFDLKGPSLTVDTGCSTSLVALHLACQSLRAGESECALVGGSNVIINPDLPITLSNMGFLSPEGRSYAFDHRAGGYGRGEGAACLVIKPLDKALKDGDPIHSVIRQTAVNSDGKTDGITQPSAVAHEQLIRYAYDEVNLNPFETDYIEAHGTGTQAGDPLELKAVGSVFGSTRTEHTPVYVGSIKTNVGHLEAASGLAGVIKTTLAMQKGVIPPNINFEKVNEKIPLDKYNIRIPLQPTPWPVTEGPRRASVNSLGYGGTNAHVILEGYEPANINGSNGIVKDPVNGKTNGHANKVTNGTNGLVNGLTNGATTNGHHTSLTDKWRVFTFSAKDEDALRDTVASTRKYLEGHKEKFVNEEDDDKFLDNLAFTLNQRRSAFRWINAFPASSVDGLTTALGGRQSPVTRQLKPPRIGFVFTGQGAQWYAMGRELLTAYPVFKHTMQTADTYLKKLGCPWSLIEELNRDQASTQVNSATVGQPLCTAVQAGLVDLLRSWNIKPTAVTGHSSGEIASAYAAGALTLEAAMQTSYHRGAIAQKTSQLTGVKGGMIAVGLSRENAEEYIKRLTTGKVVAACVNSPSNVTVSGDLAAIDELQTLLDTDGVFARKLKVNTAYHSHHMLLAMDGYLDHLKDMPTAESLEDGILCVSSVTGLPVKSAQEFGPAYWVQNAVQPVLFSDALTCMCRGGSSFPDEINEEAEAFVDVLIEIGPHGALAAPIRQILQAPALKHMPILYQSCLTRNQDARESMQIMATALLLKGAPVNLAEVNFPYDVSAGQLQMSRLEVVADLPSYPWSHKTRHWHEPRVSKQQRLREHARHDLLGVLSPGQNPAASTWRHFVRLGDQPWVKDHVVDSNILYPAAGFIAMAIEAVAQKNVSRLSKADNVGYRVHDMKILSALVVPETSDGVELQLSIFPCKEELPQADRSYEFRILSCGESDEWNEHCTGRIALEVRSVNAGESTWKKSKVLKDSPAAISLANSDKACRQDINTQLYYEGVKKLGISYGETFQNLTEIHQGPSQSLTTVQVRDTAAIMPSKLEQPHIIHPTTLDAIFQSIYPALDNNGTIMVPTHVKSLFVSQNGIISTPGSKLKISTNAEKIRNGATASLVVVHEMETSIPVVEIDELTLSSIGSSLDEINDESENEANVCFKVSHNLDISFMNRRDFSVISETPTNPTELKVSSDLQQACFYMIERALKKLTAVDYANLNGHHLAMYDWMIYQRELAPKAWFDVSDTEQDKLIATVENESVNGEMCLRVGRYLVQILRSEIEPLQIMMQDGLLYKYYEHALGMKRVYSHLSQILHLYSHKNPGARILEVGGGTGGCTVPALQALTAFGHYDFTDISSGFFEKAKEKLSQWGDRISYKKFDAEVDASIQQDIHCGEYDLVIACNVLHATARMDKTMSNVRKLLRPDGKLLIIEGTRDTLDISLVFGVLPGWWLSQEEERKFSPKLPLSAWDRLLKATGFTGQEAVMLDSPKEEDHVYSVFLSSVSTDTEKAHGNKYYPETAIILGQEQKDLPEDFLRLLSSSLEQLSGHVATVSRFDNGSPNGKVLIILAELDKPILSSLNEEEFLRLRKTLTAAKGILWVTTGGTMECSSPEAAMVTGLMRTLRTENTAIRYATLDLDPARTLQPFTSQASATIAEIFKATFDFDSPSNIDLEYSERNGQIFIPRVTQAIGSNQMLLQTGDHPPIIEDQPFYGEEDRPLKLEVGTAGLLDTMRFIDDTAAREEPLPDDYVEVAPKAFGLNFRDVMIAMGQLTETIMGYECAGVITRVGRNVTHLQPGDRVAAMMRGNYAHYIRLLGIAVSKIPDESISFEQATSMPMVFSTAYFSLYDTARLQKGETVLIHAAAGGVGQAAIMLAKLVGAEIYATVGSKEKCQLLMDTYGIPEDHIFSSRNDSFIADIMAATDGKGVDVALNSLSGHLLHATWKCMAMFGRLIEIGKRDIEINTRLDMSGFQGNVSFSAIDLTYMGRFRPKHLSDILEKCMVLAAEGKIHAVKPITVFPISDIERAFRYMQAGKHTGKVVIKPNNGDVVNVLAHPRKSSLFRGDSTYVLVGGLGGLGQSLSRWMVTNGARNLIILSRSGNKHRLAEKLAADLAQAGCENVLMPECDITNSAVVERVMKGAAKSLPPIHGVIQGAMVLNDCIFEHMSFSQYQNAVLPKVQGTWNLHNTLLDTKLDFFIMLSSAVGVVGNASQANYGAGSSFLDALAQHRRSLGLPAASLDLGIISSVGYVAENEEVAKRLARMGHDAISEQKMLGLIEVAVQQQSSTQGPSQIVTGLSLRELEAAWIQDAKFSVLRQSSSSSASSSKDESQKDKKTLQDNLQSIKSQADAVSVICDSIITKLANNLMVSDVDIDPDQPISVCGVDSLVAVELRNWLLGQTGAEISVVDILQCKSLVGLSESVAKTSKVVKKILGST